MKRTRLQAISAICAASMVAAHAADTPRLVPPPRNAEPSGPQIRLVPGQDIRLLRDLTADLYHELDVKERSESFAQWSLAIGLLQLFEFLDEAEVRESLAAIETAERMRVGKVADRYLSGPLRQTWNWLNGERKQIAEFEERAKVRRALSDLIANEGVTTLHEAFERILSGTDAELSRLTLRWRKRLFVERRAPTFGVINTYNNLAKAIGVTTGLVPSPEQIEQDLKLDQLRRLWVASAVDLNARGLYAETREIGDRILEEPISRIMESQFLTERQAIEARERSGGKHTKLTEQVTRFFPHLSEAERSAAVSMMTEKNIDRARRNRAYVALRPEVLMKDMRQMHALVLEMDDPGEEWLNFRDESWDDLLNGARLAMAVFVPAGFLSFAASTPAVAAAQAGTHSLLRVALGESVVGTRGYLLARSVAGASAGLLVGGGVFTLGAAALQTPLVGSLAWQDLTHQFLANVFMFGTVGAVLRSCRALLAAGMGVQASKALMGRPWWDVTAAMPWQARAASAAFSTGTFGAEGLSLAAVGRFEEAIVGNRDESVTFWESWAQALLTVAELKLGRTGALKFLNARVRLQPIRAVEPEPLLPATLGESSRPLITFVSDSPPVEAASTVRPRAGQMEARTSSRSAPRVTRSPRRSISIEENTLPSLPRFQLSVAETPASEARDSVAAVLGTPVDPTDPRAMYVVVNGEGLEMLFRTGRGSGVRYARKIMENDVPLDVKTARTLIGPSPKASVGRLSHIDSRGRPRYEFKNLAFFPPDLRKNARFYYLGTGQTKMVFLRVPISSNGDGSGPEVWYVYSGIYESLAQNGKDALDELGSFLGYRNLRIDAIRGPIDIGHGTTVTLARAPLYDLAFLRDMSPEEYASRYSGNLVADLLYTFKTTVWARGRTYNDRIVSNLGFDESNRPVLTDWDLSRKNLGRDHEETVGVTFDELVDVDINAIQAMSFYLRAFLDVRFVRGMESVPLAHGFDRLLSFHPVELRERAMMTDRHRLLKEVAERAAGVESDPQVRNRYYAAAEMALYNRHAQVNPEPTNPDADEIPLSQYLKSIKGVDLRDWTPLDREFVIGALKDLVRARVAKIPPKFDPESPGWLSVVFPVLPKGALATAPEPVDPLDRFSKSPSAAMFRGGNGQDGKMRRVLDQSRAIPEAERDALWRWFAALPNDPQIRRNFERIMELVNLPTFIDRAIRAEGGEPLAERLAKRPIQDNEILATYSPETLTKWFHQDLGPLVAEVPGRRLTYRDPYRRTGPGLIQLFVGYNGSRRLLLFQERYRRIGNLLRRANLKLTVPTVEWQARDEARGMVRIRGDFPRERRVRLTVKGDILADRQLNEIESTTLRKIAERPDLIEEIRKAFPSTAAPGPNGEPTIWLIWVDGPGSRGWVALPY